MSPSEPDRSAFAAAVAQISALAADPEAALSELDPADLRRLLAAAARLYACNDEFRKGTAELAESDVTATQAVTVIAALMKAQHLNSFDIELWLSTPGGPQ
jgi:hypothetical protein